MEDGRESVTQAEGADNGWLHELRELVTGPHDFVQTSPCGAGQRHPHGLVGRLWRINDPSTVRVGNCFLAGRLKSGDLFLCIRHNGDCFQDYIYVREYANCLVGKPEWRFGSYGIGDATNVPIDKQGFDALTRGERILKGPGRPEKTK